MRTCTAAAAYDARCRPAAGRQPDEDVIEVTLDADGDQAILVWEERSMPLDLLAVYRAGVRIHVEDLTAYLAGRERVDAAARWGELAPAYQDLAANMGQA